MSGFTSKVPAFTRAQDPGLDHLDETDSVDPFELLTQHPDLSLCFARLPRGERGRWYPALHCIVIDERLTQAQRRCTLMHELVHRMRGDTHTPDETAMSRQEKNCHQMVARMLIPFSSLQAAMQWGRHPQELADELWVDVETLNARILGLSEAEAACLALDVEQDERWSVA
jgi:Zn-dependent peptidase ImmA (M78 family)